MKNYESIREQAVEWAKTKLKPHRWEHTLGVESTAIALARIYGEDEEKASIAALLHDTAKYLPDEESLKVLKGLDIVRQYPEVVEYPKLYHAFVGAEMVKERFPELPEDIIDSIRYHTTGRPDMSRLEKIIFSADYIEPNRKRFPGLTEARIRMFEDLDLGVYLIFEQTDRYLSNLGETPDYFRLTKESYDFMKVLVKNEKL